MQNNKILISLNIFFFMEKGNKSINKSMVKTIFEGNILIPLPKVLVGNRFHSLFSIISPTHCDFFGTKLNVNSHYTRFILTSYGTITRNTTYWICPNCKKKFETLIGREITVKEWKKMRYKSVYVIATKEKVILDFEVTDRLPPIEALIPLFMRIKNRFPEGKIQKIVSDEDKAIIGAVKSVFPEVAHSFCVFHQLKNVSKRYNDEFKSKENIPDNDKLFCNEICQLIHSYTVISSVVCFQNIL